MNNGRSRESGFTLVEVLVTVVVSSVFAAAAASAFFLFTKSSSSANDRVLKSRDAQLAAAYFVADAQNASGPSTSLSDTSTCPDPQVTDRVQGLHDPVSYMPVARFNWSATNSSGITTPLSINYLLALNADKTSYSLLRRFCSNGSLVSDTAVAKQIQSGGVVARCSPNADCTGTPRSITISITATQDPSESDAYSYSLTGAFRQVAAGAPPSPPPGGPFPLLTLGTSGTAAARSRCRDRAW